MNRRDMIIITVLLNVALLSALLALAISDKENEAELTADMATTEKVVAPTFTVAAEPVQANKRESASYSYVPIGGEEELDSALRDFQKSNQEVFVVEKSSQPSFSTSLEKEESVKKNGSDFVDITVKRGDVLERIARANRTTVAAIIQANNLKNEKLTIGQVLHIPIPKENSFCPENSCAVAAKAPVSDAENEIYVVKNGDNPWKIARQFHVKFEDLLKLNGLDEEKARNLRAGQRLRVR